MFTFQLDNTKKNIVGTTWDHGSENWKLSFEIHNSVKQNIIVDSIIQKLENKKTLSSKSIQTEPS